MFVSTHLHLVHSGFHCITATVAGHHSSLHGPLWFLAFITVISCTNPCGSWHWSPWFPALIPVAPDIRSAWFPALLTVVPCTDPCGSWHWSSWFPALIPVALGIGHHCSLHSVLWFPEPPASRATGLYCSTSRLCSGSTVLPVVRLFLLLRSLGGETKEQLVPPVAPSGSAGMFACVAC